MLRRCHRFGFLCASIGAALFIGCGAAEERMLPVKGKVKWNGNLLAKGSVQFHPDKTKGNQSPHIPAGTIDAQGAYSLKTHPRDGAPAGWYKVAVVSTEPSDPKNPYSVPRSLIPEKFGNPEESGLSVEVRPGAPAGAYDLDLK